MKKSKIAIHLFMLLAGVEASAQLPTSGVWSTTTISSDETVNLEGDVDLKGSITVDTGVTLTLQLSDAVVGDVNIKRSENVTMFTIKGSLVIKGTSESKHIIIDGNYTKSKTGLGIVGNAASSAIDLSYVTLQDFYSTVYGSAVQMSSNCGKESSFKMANSEVKNCKLGGSKAGILYFSSSQSKNENTYSIDLTNCIFSNNEVLSTANYSGGVIYGEDDKSLACSIIGCTFENNTAVKNGGAVNWRSNYPGLTISGSSMTSNSASEGGAIRSIGVLKLSNVSFSNNSSTNGGGAIYATKSMTITGCGFSENKSVNGGAIYFKPGDTNGRLQIKGATIIENNETTADGAGIYFVKEVGNDLDLAITESCNISGNKAGGRGGAICFLRNNNTKSSYLVISGATVSGNSSANDGGGIYVGGSYAGSEVNIVESVVNNNSTTGNGGGMFNASSIKLAITDTEFKDNKAAVNGAGLSFSAGSMQLSSVEFDKNTATGNGGAAYVTSGTITLSGGYMKGNNATNGAAIASKTSNTFNMSIEGGIDISGNTATENGGALYIDKNNTSNATLTIGPSSIYDNTAVNGAAIALHRTNNDNNFTLELISGVISANTATENGGGVYLTGTGTDYKSTTIVYLKGTKISANNAKNGAGIYFNTPLVYFTGGEISENTASIDGGGIYCENATINFNKKEDGGSFTTIKNNTATQNGAGAYLYKVTATFNQGDISNNIAQGNGGGIYADGGTQKFIGEALNYYKIHDNSALNGGGLYIRGNAHATVDYLLIKNNHAIGNSTISTAWKSTPKEGEVIQGIGGGIYVGSGINSTRTTLTFNNTTSFGVYDNIADNGAQELFADGNYTNITLSSTPITGLELLGDDTAHASGWFEDYINKDDNYKEGTNAGKEGGRYPMVVNPVIASVIKVNDKYLSLTLGYPRSIVVKASGLKKGDSAVFTLTSAGDETPFCSFAITGVSDTGEPVARIIKNLAIGSWTVKETGWSWSYGVSPESRTVNHTITTSDTPTEYLFSFTKNTDIENAEAKAQNNFDVNSFRVSISVIKREDVNSGKIGL